MSLYGFVRFVLRRLIPLRVDMEVSGVRHLPSSGPFILLANHESILDPLFMQVACPRRLYAMTKSTQFARPFMRWLLLRLGAFPVRRYRVDAQAVRTALRLLEEGRGVGLYPEGERSWDGELQPFRRGAVGLVLKSGVPVVPCGVSGSYHVRPRWSRRIVRGRVAVRFGEPMEFGAHHGHAQREQALSYASRRLMRALDRLRGTDALPPDPGSGRDPRSIEEGPGEREEAG